VENVLQRDLAGDVLVIATQTIGFTLALPKDSVGPAPVTIMLHGGGGRAETDVPYVAEAAGFAQAGIATLGFTGYFSREIGLEQGTQNLAMFLPLYLQGRLPDYWAEVMGEQLAFVRATGQLATLDVLPLGRPDGTPDLDLAAPLTLVGYSAGSIEGEGLVVYAPEVRAAALVAGSARFTEQMVHQDQTGATDFFRVALPTFLPNVTPPDVWAGLAMLQMGFDRQDYHNHAAFLYRNPLTELGTSQRASLLVLEGLRDSSIPNSATRSLAWTAGPIPQLEPVAESVPFLDTFQGPITANIDAETTAAFFQYIPAGIPGLKPSVGCEFEPEGHYCAQNASSSRAQVLRFLRTALSQPAPTISAVPELDTDGDGVADAVDNCPYLANANQTDTGGIGSGSAPDGIGDACQCGDANGDGRLTLADAVIVQRSLLQPPTATLARPELCDVGAAAPIARWPTP